MAATTAGKGKMRLLTLLLTLTTVTAAPGADVEVQQVQGPHVVKHALGPRMEVLTQAKPDLFREQREASPCYSCTHTYNQPSNYGGYSSWSSWSSWSDGVENTPGGPVSTREESRRQQKFVNGQPVYELTHDVRYHDGRLVHEEKVEKDEDDFDHQPQSTNWNTVGRHTSTSQSNNQAGTTSYYSRPGYQSNIERHRVQGQNYGTSDYSHSGSYGRDSSHSEAETARRQEERRRQLELHGGQYQPAHGNSQRRYYSSQVRYVNGQPVYKKEEEKKFQDGQLVYNHTEELGSDDIGTDQRYDSNGVLIGDSSRSSSNERSRSQYGQHTPANYGGRQSIYPNYDSSYSSHSQKQNQYSPTITGHRPSTVSSSHRESSSDIYNRQPSPTGSYPSYQYSQDSRYASASSRTPPRDSTYQYSGESSDSSSQHTHTPSSQDSYPYRPTSQGSYPSYRPTLNRQSTEYSRETSHTSSSYQPTSSQTSTQYTEQSRQSSSYPSHRPTSSVYYRGEGHQSAESGSHSTEEDQFTPYPVTPSPQDDLELTHIQQQSFDSPDSARTVQQSSESSRTWESSVGERRPHRPHTSSGGYSNTHHSATHYGEYDQRQQDTSRTTNYSPSIVTQSGGARTVAVDLSSSSTSDSRRPTADRLIGSNLNEDDDDDDDQQQPIGIPGVISGPARSSDEDIDETDSQRYDISPLEDDHAQTFPSVDYEVETDYIAPIPDDDEDESDETDDGRRTDSGRHYSQTDSTRHQQGGPFSGSSSTSYYYNRTHTRQGEYIGDRTPSDAHSRFDYSQTREDDSRYHQRPASTAGSSSYHYNEESHRRTSAAGSGLQQAAPATTSVSSSSLCSQEGGCVLVSPSRSTSYRTEFRTTKKYLNGELVGLTHYERRYENGQLVSENVTEKGLDELTAEDFAAYGVLPADIPQTAYQTGGYSQRHEISEEQKYVDGQQVYGLYHRQQYENGVLVDEERTEKDEDDYRVPGATAAGQTYRRDEETRHVTQQHQESTGAVAAGRVDHASQTNRQYDSTQGLDAPTHTSSHRYEHLHQEEYVDGQPVHDLRHERRYQDGVLVHEDRTELGEQDIRARRPGVGIVNVGVTFHGRHGSVQKNPRPQQDVTQTQRGQQHLTQTQRGQQHVTQTQRGQQHLTQTQRGQQHLTQTQRGQQHLTQTQQGQQHLTQTQQGQQHSTSGRADGGYRQTTQDSQVHDTSRVSYVPTYSTSQYERRREQEFINGKPVRDNSHERRFQDGTLIYENRTELGEQDLNPSGYSDALHQIMESNTLNTASDRQTTGTSYSDNTGFTGTRDSHDSSTGSSQTSQSYYGSGSSRSTQLTGGQGFSSSSEQANQETYGASGSSLLGTGSHGSGRATTTVIGGSDSLLTGSGSLPGSGSTSGYDGSSRSSSSSSHSTSSTFQQSRGGSGAGCLTCVLLGGTGHSSMDGSSHGQLGGTTGGTGGYSRKEEQSTEERYENGQLVHGQEESRRFEDGQLVHENRRVYGSSDAQDAQASALQSAGTSFMPSHGSSSSSQSSYSSSSSSFSSSGSGLLSEDSAESTCASNTCNNGGTCLQGILGPICTCRFGFSGRFCSEIECPRGYCRRGGQCSVEGDVHVCNCREGFTGPRCEFRTQRNSRRHTRTP